MGGRGRESDRESFSTPWLVFRPIETVPLKPVCVSDPFETVHVQEVSSI